MEITFRRFEVGEDGPFLLIRERIVLPHEHGRRRQWDTNEVRLTHESLADSPK
jgi:hypothetical protein